MRIDRDIQSLTDFKRDTAKFIEQMKETKSAVVLTVNGRAELVVQDAKSYQELLDAVERSETVTGIRRGLEQMRRGDGIPADEAFEQLRQRVNATRG